MTIHVDLSDAVLSATWGAAGSHEILAVFPGHIAWYWALVPSDERHSDAVGSFHTSVDEEEWPAIEDLADRVTGTGGVSRPGGLGMTLTAGSAATWASAGTELAGIVGAVALPLIERARAHPVAVARLHVQVLTAPTGERVAAYRLQSIGSAPVVLQFDPNAFQLGWPDRVWEELAPPQIGLVDADVNLLDGMHRPASIPPGGIGALTIPVLEDRPPAATSGAVSGNIVLAGPWSPEVVYEERFRATARGEPIDLSQHP